MWQERVNASVVNTTSSVSFKHSPCLAISSGPFAPRTFALHIHVKSSLGPVFSKCALGRGASIEPKGSSHIHLQEASPDHHSKPTTHPGFPARTHCPSHH